MIETKPTEVPSIKAPTLRPDKPKTRAKAVPAPRPGAVFGRDYKGKSYKLRAVEENGKLAFRLGSKKFDSLTAAAKDVTGYASISGPMFWGKSAK